MARADPGITCRTPLARPCRVFGPTAPQLNEDSILASFNAVGTHCEPRRREASFATISATAFFCAVEYVIFRDVCCSPLMGSFQLPVLDLSKNSACDISAEAKAGVAMNIAASASAYFIQTPVAGRTVFSVGLAVVDTLVAIEERHPDMIEYPQAQGNSGKSHARDAQRVHHPSVWFEHHVEVCFLMPRIGPYFASISSSVGPPTLARVIGLIAIVTEALAAPKMA